MMKSYKVLPTRQNYFQPKNERGFTLVELIVTIAVLAILTMIAMPYILEQLARMEAKRIESQIRNTLTLAKAESYIRRQDLLVCLSNNGAICDRDSYKQLLLFSDRNNNNNFDLGVDDLLERQALEPKYSTVYLRVGDKRHYTKFWGDSGKPRGHFGHFKYCPTSTYNHIMYQISFSQGGRVTYKPNASYPTDCGK
ncbi:Tfp pilus assembly protein FimT/FimU [uncultured Psychrobacter sp.]|uniref:pilus assembly FimT family protein n=1 Tax=uncultured Psychrobacter sp. TaxID=259303 RepID=UPI002621C3EB|nr:GspH/FimT family pseudopilin [uncultured Psychrobacter sp.]